MKSQFILSIAVLALVSAQSVYAQGTSTPVVKNAVKQEVQMNKTESKKEVKRLHADNKKNKQEKKLESAVPSPKKS